MCRSNESQSSSIIGRGFILWIQRAVIGLVWEPYAAGIVSGLRSNKVGRGFIFWIQRAVIGLVWEPSAAGIVSGLDSNKRGELCLYQLSWSEIITWVKASLEWFSPRWWGIRRELSPRRRTRTRMNLNTIIQEDQMLYLSEKIKDY